MKSIKIETLPVKNIKGNIDPSVADMAEVVGGNATNVHTHSTGNPRPK